MRRASVPVGRFLGGVCFPLNSFIHFQFQRAFSSALTFYALKPLVADDNGWRREFDRPGGQARV